MPHQLTEEVLREHHTLSPCKRALLPDKKAHSRLGFAVLLKTILHLGRFPEEPDEVAGAAVAHLASQLEVPPEAFMEYWSHERTVADHRAKIRDALGFREASKEDQACLAEWLSREAAPAEPTPGAVQEAACVRLRHLDMSTGTGAMLQGQGWRRDGYRGGFG
ncbi:MAG: DUF4158 domain-containing protein [Candidatus Schekmanbacteria bacterium]|nr:DUF4158 domain-containing protein [Candidatus Schekmanbacteria bacterium]